MADAKSRMINSGEYGKGVSGGSPTGPAMKPAVAAPRSYGDGESGKTFRVDNGSVSVDQGGACGTKSGQNYGK